MAEKFYDSSDVTIYQGDSINILKTLHNNFFDAVVTDPPYPGGSGSKSTNFKYPDMLGAGKDQHSFIIWCFLWMSECFRVSKDGAPMLVFTNWRQLPSVSDALQAAGWDWLGIIPWNKRNSRTIPGKFKHQCEYVLFGSKGSYKPLTRSPLPGFYEYPVVTNQRFHLTSKPVELLKDLLTIVQSDGLVLDPFLGGGTTALACLETGRRCIGVELSEEYAGISSERMRKFFQDKE